jgi:hypothetical protein
MTIDERLETITQQLEVLTSLQLANERRFEKIGKIFKLEHESIMALRLIIAEAHQHRLDDLED